MSANAAQQPGGPTVVGRVVGPALSKITKLIPWRKYGNLVAAIKTAMEKLETLQTPLDSLSLSSADVAAAEVILSPLLLAVDTAAPKIVVVAVDAIFRLFSQNLLRFSLSSVDDGKTVVSHLIVSVCKCGRSGDEAVELGALKAVLAAVRSPRVSFHGEFLDFIVKSCYNVYLGSKIGNSRVCAKAVLAQIVSIVFARAY